MLKIEKDRLRLIFDAMLSKSIMVIGDLMLDEYIWGKVERISPEAPVPVVEVSSELFKLGGSGNVANNLLSLGAGVIINAVKGNDRHGLILQDILEEMKIPDDSVFTDPKRGTTVKTRIIAHTQQVARIDKENKSLISDTMLRKIVTSFRNSLKKIDALIISDYGKGVVSRRLLAQVVPLARENDIPVCVDTKERNFPHYKKATVITPNLKELSFGAGIKIEEYADMVRAARKVKAMLDCDMVLVTRGEHGMSLFGSDGDPIDIPTNAKAVYDVTGAGDTVIACFTLALASGATPKESAIIANMAAGLVVAEVGAASVPRDRLYKACMEELSG
ncbi:MAG TPA: D-glycero-beta-D-manno-heptose-7-phosphate kinase [Deltaproteobacteria bacterium]|nr:D-glycero-beta-D-manno-heptose-7-phosphate kinase [Deltaproteobacteria bacterium]HPR54967.1 D-glycero-beta-D-manno-heptose-7-phosphate kinase [Deltaproteobacteria bacterium]HXK46305.1 D-glycero-beta-D-manno-heptose-7-phosphate kinase [Deltaproteobacteria bacterium]